MASHTNSGFSTAGQHHFTRVFGVFPAMVVFSLWMLVLLTACGKQEEPPAPEAVRPVKMMTLSGGQDALRRAFPGKVQAAKSVDLAFKVAGPLVEFPVTEGQSVAAGDLIARIDPRDFKTELQKIDSAIGEATAQLRAMQSGARPEDIKVLEAEVKAARARALNAEQQYSRYKDLFVQRQVSKADFDRYKSDRDVANAQLNTARQNLDAGRKGARQEDVDAMMSKIKGLEAQRKGTRDALADTRLKAPFLGYIATKYVDNYQEIRAKQAIVSLQDVSSVEVQINVPESIVAQGKRRAVTTASAEFASAPGKQFALSVKEFATAADPQTQTYRVTLIMPQPEEVLILPGMTANVLITRSAASDRGGTITIPTVALFADDSGISHVWVYDPDQQTLHRRKVVTGDLSGTDRIRISDGLQPGETIAIAGVSRLREGMRVRPLKE